MRQESTTDLIRRRLDCKPPEDRGTTDPLDDIPYRNERATARALGSFVMSHPQHIGDRWLPTHVIAIVENKIIPALYQVVQRSRTPNPSGKGGQKYQKKTAMVGYSTVQRMLNRREEYEAKLDAVLPKPTGIGRGAKKPSSWGDEWFSLGEVSKVLGKSHHWVNGQIESGQLKTDCYVLPENEQFNLPKKNGLVLVEMLQRVHRQDLKRFMQSLYRGTNGTV